MSQVNLGAISTMRLPELRETAKSLGLEVDPKAKKADLVAAIRSVTGPARRGRPPKVKNRQPALELPKANAQKKADDEAKKVDDAARATAEDTAQAAPRSDEKAGEPSARPSQSESSAKDAQAKAPADIVLPEPKGERGQREVLSRRQRRERNQQRNNNGQGRQQGRGRNDNLSDTDRRAALDAIGEAAVRRAGGDDVGDRQDRGERNRRERNRNRNRGREGASQFQVREDEELLPVAGILDFEGNNAILRTGGYLPGSNDAAVPPQIVRQHGLRRGDAIVGAVRQRGEGETHHSNNRGRNQNRKHNAHSQLNQLLQIDTINSLDPERSAQRPEFNKLTPLYPQEMLRLETTPKALTPRSIDLVAPIGKGQRGLVVSPPKAGKTMVMQQIAMAIASNNPRVHLMVVLVDERPEEVTDMKRLVKGEVIASTFDRPASDHTIVAELAIERAKRLVELGQDVVVLLDSLTRLSRAYNLAAPASGRILSGGVDAAALYPPKKFFGAARNIEDGGSLTIIASALVETGSKMDEVIFEEFKGTGNMELRLSRQLADRRIFPAVDVNASSTRREELLFSPEELKVIWQLRRALGTLDVTEASDFFLGRLRKTESNAEFLVSIMKSMQAGGSN
ncbi:MAG: transcription termination factor Rho [Actinomycetaceae bacterium]|nr:transcription termination factor Rho [Actinomycetaceae bacterium]